MVTETDTVGLAVRLLVRDREGGPVRADCLIDAPLYSPEFIDELEALILRFTPTGAGHGVRVVPAQARVGLSLR